VAAQRLGITLTPFEVGVMRADRALAQLDDILAQAQANGDLRKFNAAYKTRRLRAQATGQRFMSYPAAQAKLTRSLVAEIAVAEAGRPFSIAVAMARVFEPPRR